MKVRLPHPLWILLAALLLLLIAAGLGIAIPHYRQQTALREIERLNGSVSMLGGGPDWLRRWIGDDRMRPFDKVSAVDLARSKVTDGDLIWLAQLRGLRRLNLWTARISDAGLVHLRDLTELRRLDLDDTRVSDAGLVHLYPLTHLERVTIRATHVTDEGIAELRRRLPDTEIVK